MQLLYILICAFYDNYYVYLYVYIVKSNYLCVFIPMREFLCCKSIYSYDAFYR